MAPRIITGTALHRASSVVLSAVGPKTPVEIVIGGQGILGFRHCLGVQHPTVLREASMVGRA